MGMREIPELIDQNGLFARNKPQAPCFVPKGGLAELSAQIMQFETYDIYRGVPLGPTLQPTLQL